MGSLQFYFLTIYYKKIMPSAYTEIITRKQATFAEFALRCARSFGALSSMRDDTLDAPIPDRIEPTDYYYTKYQAAVETYMHFESMTEEEAAVALRKVTKAFVKHRKESKEKNSAETAMYMDMLAQVIRWEPPTPEHRGLKRFMVEQIMASIDDYYETPNPYEGFTPELFLIAERSKAAEYVERCKSEHREEVERCERKTEWIQALKQSLKEV